MRYHLQFESVFFLRSSIVGRHFKRIRLLQAMDFFQSVYVGKIIYDDFTDDLRFDIAVIIEVLLMEDFFSDLE